MWRMNFEFFIKSRRFETPWARKNVFLFFYSSKTFLWKLKIQYSRQNIRDTIKMLGNKCVYFKKIYNFSIDHYFIGDIFFVYWWKILLNIKKTFFLGKTTRNTKKIVHLQIKIYKFILNAFFLKRHFSNYTFFISDKTNLRYIYRGLIKLKKEPHLKILITFLTVKFQRTLRKIAVIYRRPPLDS